MFKIYCAGLCVYFAFPFTGCYKKSCLDDAEFMLCTIKFKYSRLAVAFPSEAFDGSPVCNNENIFFLGSLKFVSATRTYPTEEDFCMPNPFASEICL